VKQKES